MRMTATVIACKRLTSWQIDYVAAYLNSINKFEVYMEQPWPFVVQGKEHMVLQVNKTVYGMMQGAYDWEDELSRTYKRLGYYQSCADPCIRHRLIDGKEGEGNRQDGRVLRGEEDMTQDEKTGTITLSQQVFAKRTLERFSMSDCNAKSMPLPCGIKLSELNSPRMEEETLFMKDKPYREALGCVMWLQANLGPAHWRASQHVLTYIKGTLHYKITYDPNSADGLKVAGYSNSDYAGDANTMRSTGGYIYTMAGGPVTWSSKQQAMTASSTMEAEYMALNRACQQAVWMQGWISEARLEQMSPALIHGDNKGSVDLAKNIKGITKAKHIHVKHHYIRECVKDSDMEIVQIPTDDNIADILTKPLPQATHEKFTHALGLCDA
ncbi:unnamed protein product [Cyclocybe aegerita]|uniref:Reverse transcriptase Ty1/copia-type domain-containing protein n=1 Tax=Cyclocybe aegerita TaxID=1973307 RepID=A0A8S0WC08_CYCAE|nr:unnamed protein product [Cyclocybe aegerita]